MNKDEALKLGQNLQKSLDPKFKSDIRDMVKTIVCVYSNPNSPKGLKKYIKHFSDKLKASELENLPPLLFMCEFTMCLSMIGIIQKDYEEGSTYYDDKDWSYDPIMAEYMRLKKLEAEKKVRK